MGSDSQTTGSEESSAVATRPTEPKNSTVPSPNQETGMVQSQGYQTPQHIGEMWQEAKILAQAEMVPDAYRKHPSDCFVAVQLSRELGINPFVFMQQSYPVHGKIGIQGKLVIALINTRGPYENGIQFDGPTGEGDAKKIRAWGVRKTTGAIEEMSLSVKEVKLAGWWDKPQSWWPKLTDQMLHYRVASLFCDRFCPEVRLGLATIDEIVDAGDGVEVVKRHRLSDEKSEDLNRKFEKRAALKNENS